MDNRPVGHPVMALLSAPEDENAMPLYHRTYSRRNHANFVGGDSRRIYYWTGRFRYSQAPDDQLVVVGPPEVVTLDSGPAWGQPVMWKQNWRRNYHSTRDVGSIPPAARYRLWLILVG